MQEELSPNMFFGVDFQFIKKFSIATFPTSLFFVFLEGCRTPYTPPITTPLIPSIPFYFISNFLFRRLLIELLSEKGDLKETLKSLFENNFFFTSKIFFDTSSLQKGSTKHGIPENDKFIPGFLFCLFLQVLLYSNR